MKQAHSAPLIQAKGKSDIICIGQALMALAAFVGAFWSIGIY